MRPVGIGLEGALIILLVFAAEFVSITGYQNGDEVVQFFLPTAEVEKML
jgi:hypothetical protein